MNVFCPSCSGQFTLDGTRVGASLFCPFCGHEFSLANGETRAAGEGAIDPAQAATTPVAADAELNPSLASPTGGLGAQEPDEDFGPGTRIDRYELQELVGRGGMGSVWRANQTSLGRSVAIKLLPRSLARQEEFVVRFEREARTMAALSHPNIVAVHDRGVHEGRPYIVMELVDGVSLRRLMRSGELTREQALDLIPQVLDALDYAHDMGVIHRDIKPENILVTKRGRARVADFGLARMLSLDTSQRLTRTNMLMGTPDYMAPEQRERAKTVDHRADLYALGVVLYELLTGELPLGNFEPPSARVHDGDRRFDTLVMRVLATDPSRRHQRASHLRSELIEVMEAGADCDGNDTNPAQPIASKRDPEAVTTPVVSVSAVTTPAAAPVAAHVGPALRKKPKVALLAVLVVSGAMGAAAFSVHQAKRHRQAERLLLEEESDRREAAAEWAKEMEEEVRLQSAEPPVRWSELLHSVQEILSSFELEVVETQLKSLGNGDTSLRLRLTIPRYEYVSSRTEIIRQLDEVRPCAHSWKLAQEAGWTWLVHEHIGR